jgi:hypothetical protein
MVGGEVHSHCIASNTHVSLLLDFAKSLLVFRFIFTVIFRIKYFATLNSLAVL